MLPEALIAYQDHSLLITDSTGFIEKRIEGFYYHQTRFLSKLRLLVNGEAPIFVSANLVDSYSQIVYYLSPLSTFIAAPSFEPIIDVMLNGE